MSVDLQVVLVAIVAGVFIELFFRTIKYRDSLNSNGPKSKYENLDSYASVSEFVGGGNRKWEKYILFRFTPPLIIFLLLASVLNKYYPTYSLMPPLLLSAFISVLFRDLISIFQKNILREQLVHLMNTALVLAAALLVSSLDGTPFLETIAPSIPGLVDNVWSSLLIAALVVYYFEATNMSRSHQDDNAERIAKENYVLNSYTEIKKKYHSVVQDVCTTYDVSEILFYALLIYENMNRPEFIRKLENLIVRFTSRELTVGIAQIKSEQPLSDELSIKKAGAEVLKDSSSMDFGGYDLDSIELKQQIEKYNNGDDYYQSIISILRILKIYKYTELDYAEN